MARVDTVEVRNEGGYWSVYVNGRQMVDRESYQIANNVADCLRNPDARPNTESAEVARAIRDAVEGGR
jgi:hypothetical protein